MRDLILMVEENRHLFHDLTAAQMAAELPRNPVGGQSNGISRGIE
jgi:hypothetical protein